MASSGSIVKGKRFDWGGYLLYTFLTLFAIIMLMPLVYMVSTAFKPISELFLFPPKFFVMNPTLKNFYNLLLVSGSSFVPFTRYVFNSAVVSTAIVVGGIILSSMAE